VPALPSPGAVIKTNIQWSIKGDVQGETILFWSYTSGAPSATDLSTFAGDIVNAGSVEFQALCDNFTGMTACTARDLSSDMGNEATAGTPWVGTRGTELLSPATSAVVSHSISRHYRGGHPRTYLPVGISSDVATSGLWSTGFVSSVDTAWGTFVGGVLGASPYGSLAIAQLVNVSYFGPPNRTITGSTGRVRTVSTVRDTPIVDRITGHVTRRNIGSQRRRNRDA
jgi:hypothetical protein